MQWLPGNVYNNHRVFVQRFPMKRASHISPSPTSLQAGYFYANFTGNETELLR